MHGSDGSMERGPGPSDREHNLMSQVSDRARTDAGHCETASRSLPDVPDEICGLMPPPSGFVRPDAGACTHKLGLELPHILAGRIHSNKHACPCCPMRHSSPHPHAWTRPRTKSLQPFPETHQTLPGPVPCLTYLFRCATGPARPNTEPHTNLSWVSSGNLRPDTGGPAKQAGLGWPLLECIVGHNEARPGMPLILFGRFRSDA